MNKNCNSNFFKNLYTFCKQHMYHKLYYIFKNIIPGKMYIIFNKNVKDLLRFVIMVQWLESGTPTRTIRVRFPSDWLLHHGDNRGRHSANHNLLPDMHLRVRVLRVKTCRDSRLV